ncbi:adenosine deaminase [Corynebacterium sp. TAE3-ERU12]|uniref:adenosine deaminase n=1 Tax=Corynebacterium sp. TAE3-ERU12 TaxID=2849491 RepID=UPI001C443959|nr:adenosine deaminase [Corynebacterium sp. TAE3-ERU12]MBV7294758.1 adenosine deaminase [Corynebacterium sp. TAE3-ERU12]
MPARPGAQSDATAVVSSDIVAALPKVVLLDHIDGGIRPATVLDLAAELDYDDLPADNADALAQWFVAQANSGSAGCRARALGHIRAVLQTAPALARAAREAVEDLAGDNVVYAELRIAPQLHMDAGLSIADVIAATVEGLRAGEHSAAEAGCAITARLIVCARRDREGSAAIARAVADAYTTGSPVWPYVVGFDLTGVEANNPVSEHTEALTVLRQHLVPTAIHAGESAGVDSIREATIAGASRIGHGVRIFEDFTASFDGIELQPLSRYVRDRRIPLDLCPSANVHDGIVDDLHDHPLPLLDDLGFTCTVNTGFRLLCGTSMTREMMHLVDNFDYGYTELFQLTCNAIENCFADLPTRERILDTQIYPHYLELTDRDHDGEIDVDEDLEPFEDQ